MYKNKIYKGVLIVMMLSLLSCTEELLNPVPESILTTSNAFRNARDINLGVLGIYNRLQDRINTDFELMEFPSGDMWGEVLRIPGVEDISVLNVNPDNPRINTFWTHCYNGIFRANFLLSKIDIPTDYSESQKDQYSGEAKFLRAYFYFDLVRIFGGVPAITSVISTEEAKNTGRASEQEIYNLIVADLKDAVSTLPLPADAQWGRASKGAAIALLAKVYVYLKDWNQAKTYLDQLDDFNYSLVTDYASLFKEETEVNDEAIFSIAFVATTNPQYLSTTFPPIIGIYQVLTSGAQVGRPTWDLHRAFEPGDSRFPQTIVDECYPYTREPNDPPIWYPYFNKWVVPCEFDNSGLDVPLIRFADVLLLKAETYYNLNQPNVALTEINRVRQRAFGNSSHNYTLADIGTKETFYDKLLLERRLELALECNRWFDLVRTGRFTSVLQNVLGSYNDANGTGAIPILISAKPYMKYFPIPSEQIRLATPGVLVQNDGY